MRLWRGSGACGGVRVCRVGWSVFVMKLWVCWVGVLNTTATSLSDYRAVTTSIEPI